MRIPRLLLLLLFICVVSLVVTTACYADRITGKISVLDAKDDTIEISGVKIFAADVSIENESGQPMKLRDLEVGDWAQIEGSFSGPAALIATKIVNKRAEFGGIRGKIEKHDPQGKIIISGITVLVPISAVLEGEGGKQIPFNMFIRGINVRCTGEWTGMKELTAVKVQVEY